MHDFRNNLTHRNDRVTAQDSASIARARRLGCLNRRTERNNGGQIRAPHQRGRGGGRKKCETIQHVERNEAEAPKHHTIVSAQKATAEQAKAEDCTAYEVGLLYTELVRPRCA